MPAAKVPLLPSYYFFSFHALFVEGESLSPVHIRAVNAALFILLLKLFELWLLQILSGCFLYPSNIFPSFYFLSTSLLSCARWYKLMLQLSCPAGSSRNLVSSLSLVFKNKIWVLQLLIATGVLFLVGPLNKQSLCINSCILLYLYFFVFYSSVYILS